MTSDTWNVEVLELGYWDSVGTTPTELDAIRVAQILVQDIREEHIRILDPNDKEL